MSRILKPDKRLIVPGYRSYRNLDEAMRLSNPEDGHNIDLWATIEVKNANGFSQGRHTFRCRSFVRQFIDFLQSNASELNTGATVLDWCNNSRILYGANYSVSATPQYNLYSVAAAGWCWHGPVCGTGVTAAVIGDYKMEKLVPHGVRVANASIITGTGTSESWSDPNYTLTKSAAGWTVNAYANCFLAFTSGAASGTEIAIYSNTATALVCNDAAGYIQTPVMRAFPPVDPGATPNFTVKTYGQLAYGSVSFTAPTDDGALQSKFSLSRDFTNNQGGAFTVNEVGWYANLVMAGGGSACGLTGLMARDVLGAPVALNNTQVMTLTYSIIVNA